MFAALVVWSWPPLLVIAILTIGHFELAKLKASATQIFYEPGLIRRDDLRCRGAARLACFNSGAPSL